MRAPDFSSARWRKSARSNGGTGNCVEVAATPGGIGIRDSKLGQHSPIIAIAPQQWADLQEHIKHTE